MKVYNFFKSLVFTITTAMMFFFWSIISEVVSANPLYGILLGGVISLGTYRLVLKFMELLLLKIKPVKKWAFGNAFLEGIWVGCYKGLNGELCYYIEYFEQDFSGLVIRGKSFNQDNTFKGTWISEKVMIDEEKGIISYTYETDMLNNNHKNQGLAHFTFERTGKEKYPTELIGYTSVIFSPTKQFSIEKRVSDNKKYSEIELLEKAHAICNDNDHLF